MLGTLIVSMAMMGQAPAAAPAGGAKAEESAKLIAKRRAKKTTRYVARVNREAAEAEAARKRAEWEYKEWKSLLPYQLEHQRQMLQRQSDAERNAALNRLAGAAERRAGYIYPGQSPTVGPYR